MPRTTRYGIEDVAVVVLSALATLYLEWRIMFEAGVFQSDALVHTYWMRRFSDHGLFHDPLTNVLVRSGYVPLGVQAIYYCVSQLVDPVRFGAVGALAVAPLSAWLVFRIVLEHTDWRPAPWLGAALFLLPWSVQQFNGLHARAFGEPIVLLTLYLVLRGKKRCAAVIPPAAALLYPPVAVISLLLVIGAIVKSVLEQRRPLRRWIAVAFGSVAATAFAAMVPRLVGVQRSDLIAGAVAHRYPDFGPHGQMHFFSSSIITMLRGPYSGFDLDTAGSVLLAAFIAVLLVPGNFRRVRVEVWMLAVICLVMFAASYGVLFRLYLPSRYVHPLIGVFSIVVAVCWEPTWSFIARVVGLRLLVGAAGMVPAAVVWLGLCLLPLGPEMTLRRLAQWVLHDRWLYLMWLVAASLLAVAMHVIARRDGRRSAVTFAAVLAGTLLVGGVALAGSGQAGGKACPDTPVFRYLSTLPKDTVVAGDPIRIDCVPIVSKRPVLMSKKLYQVYDLNVFRFARPRMFAELMAYYGSSRDDVARLHTKYGADVLVVDRDLSKPSYLGMAPFKELVARLRRSVRHPAVRRLPSRCIMWRDAADTVYDLRCVAS
jgi:hypothetical protein